MFSVVLVSALSGCSVLTSFDGFTGNASDAATSDVPDSSDAVSPDGASAEASADAEVALNECVEARYVDRTAENEDRTVLGPSDVSPRQYKPPCMKVRAGRTVTFKSEALVYIDYFADHPLEPFGGDRDNPIPVTSAGGEKTVEFPTPGKFGFRCKLHPATMAGAIWVVP